MSSASLSIRAGTEALARRALGLMSAGGEAKGDLRDVLGSATRVFLIRVAGAGVTYLGILFMVRWMGAFQFGVYAYVWSWALLLGFLLPLGLNSAVLRFVPEYHARGFDRRVVGFVARSRLIVAGVSTGAAVAAVLGIVAFREALPAHYVLPLLVGLACVPLLAINDLYVGISRGFGWTALAYTPHYVMQPLLLVAGMALLVALGIRPTAPVALALVLLSVTVTLAVLAVAVRQRMGRIVPPAAAPRYHTRYWMMVALPLLMMEGFRTLLEQTDVLMLGKFATPEDISVYFAALRTAGVLGFLHFAIAAMAAPRIARLHAAGTRAELQDFVAGVVRLSFWPSLAAAIVLLASGGLLLRLFGPGFEAGYPAFAVLVVSLLLRAATGPAEYILNMTGEQRACARIYMLVALANLVANVVLIPVLGILGAALATGGATVMANAWLVVEARRRLGVTAFIMPLPGTRPRAVRGA